jgi:hypothetical protein
MTGTSNRLNINWWLACEESNGLPERLEQIGHQLVGIG